MLFLLWFSLVSPAVCDVVETSKGALRGYPVTASGGQTVRVFKSVPISAPPIGPLRFTLPQPHSGWQGVRDATQYSAACMSRSPFSTSPQGNVSEDCLYINLFIGEECTVATPCPVLTFFHGGINNFDSAIMYNDSHIVGRVASQGVIFAIPAFRLGIFGLLTLKHHSVLPTNLAIYDMIASLRWIQNEIAAFGGDRDTVTIMGQSQGAANVMNLALSSDLSIPGQAWNGRKLFHRVAMLSGGVESCPMESMQRATMRAALLANCSHHPTDSSTEEDELIVECLRTLTSNQLVDISYQLDIEMGHPAFHQYVHAPPFFYEDSIMPSLENPQPYDYLFGSTSHEWGYDGEAKKGKGMSDFLDRQPKAGELLALQNIDEIAEKVSRDAPRFNASYYTQLIYASNYIVASAVKQRRPKSNVFAYQLDTATNNHHASDLYYVVGVHPRDLTDEESKVMDMYANMFIDFAKYGRPRDDMTQFSPHLGNYYSIRFNETEDIFPIMKNGYHYDIVDYWLGELIEYDGIVSARKGVKQRRPYPIVNRMLSPSDRSLTNLSFLFLLAVAAVAFIVIVCFCRRKSGYETLS